MSTKQKLDLHRKIIADTTSRGWNDSPHICAVYEPEATRLLETLEDINSDRNSGRISVNTVMLKIIAEALVSCPRLNAHIHYNKRLTRGYVTIFDNVDITMPVMLGDHTTVTLNIHSVEQKSLTGIEEAVKDSIRRAKKSNLHEALYEVAFHDTMIELRRFHIFKALGRLIGFRLDGGQKTLLHGTAKRKYKKIPATERLTRHDLEQGTITVSNIGTLYRGRNVRCTLIDIVPPQVVAIAINPIQERVFPQSGGGSRIGKVLPLTIAHDHRALNGADFIPFFERIEQIMSAPELLKKWI